MKISILAIDAPLPANSGARIDINRSLKALTAAGHEIQLFAWAHAASKGFPPEAFRDFCQEIHFMDYRHDLSLENARSPREKAKVFLQKVFHWVPSICLLLRLAPPALESMLSTIERFSPDVLIVEGVQAWGPMLQVLEHLGRQKPVIYRSQNWESKYCFSLGLHQQKFSKSLPFYIDALKLIYFEPFIFRKSDVTLQISWHDFQRWNRLQMGRQVWVPPLIDESPAPPRVTILYDVLLMSGWGESQKAAGLRWFINEVKPRLPKHLSVAIAGRGASPDLQELCVNADCLFLGEVEDSALTLAQGRVLVNAVFHGSGVYMKMLDMLRAERCIVSTTDGTGGLSQEICELIRVTNDPASFAREIEQAQSAPVDVSKIRQALEPLTAKYHVNQMNGILAECLSNKV